MDYAPPTTLSGLAFAPFKARAPWWGGDLQTLSNYLRPHRVSLDPYPEERLLLSLADGSGDRLAAVLTRPAAASDKPLVVLIHGLSGHERSRYLQRSTVALLALNYPVLRLNLRGAGPSRPYCRLHYHAGRSLDLEHALAALPPELKRHGIVAVGYSLGGNMLLKFLGERGTAAPFLAAVSVSAPIDLAACAQRMRLSRNFIYQAYLMRDMRSETMAPIAELTTAERDAVRSARTIWDFDRTFSAPRNGFGGIEDYYQRNSAQHYLGGIAVPTLMIHGLDDPWIPPDPYLAFDWRSNPNLVPLLAHGGGHVGFQGQDRRAAWHDLMIGQFLDAMLSRA